MTFPAPAAKSFVLRAKRDTVLLVVSVTAMTFALSYSVHLHRPVASPAAPPQQAWMGALPDSAAREEAAQSSQIMPITSASLVVARSELALPQPPVRPLVRLHGCDGTLCSSRAATAPSPPRRPAVSEGTTIVQATHATTHRTKPSLMSRLNPFNHLPDSTMIRRPFTVASDTVSGWFKRF